MYVLSLYIVANFQVLDWSSIDTINAYRKSIAYPGELFHLASNLACYACNSIIGLRKWPSNVSLFSPHTPFAPLSP